jgi:phosphoribosylaminoimidazole (AIR) synthetase
VRRFATLTCSLAFVASASLPALADSTSPGKESAFESASISPLPVGDGVLLTASLVKGMAHITGGGVTDNVPRILPAGTAAEVRRGSWEVPALFAWLTAAGEVPLDDQYRAFNMGIGLIVAVSAADASHATALLRQTGESPAVVGRIVAGTPGVVYV